MAIKAAVSIDGAVLHAKILYEIRCVFSFRVEAHKKYDASREPLIAMSDLLQHIARRLGSGVKVANELVDIPVYFRIEEG